MLDLKRIKDYNSQLKATKSEIEKVNSEIMFNERELEKACKELSDELGIEVTAENAASILSERVEKINNTLQIGEDVLKRIKAESAELDTAGHPVANNGGYAMGNMQTQPNVSEQHIQPMNQPMGQPQQQMMPNYGGQQVPNMFGMAVPQQPVQQAPIQPMVQTGMEFGQPVQMANNQPVSGDTEVFEELPNLFGGTMIKGL